MFTTFKFNETTQGHEAISRSDRPPSAADHIYTRTACDLCRASKSECSGDNEGCDRCIATSARCTYTLSSGTGAGKKRLRRSTNTTTSTSTSLGTSHNTRGQLFTTRVQRRGSRQSPLKSAHAGVDEQQWPSSSSGISPNTCSTPLVTSSSTSKIGSTSTSGSATLNGIHKSNTGARGPNTGTGTGTAVPFQISPDLWDDLDLDLGTGPLDMDVNGFSSHHIDEDNTTNILASPDFSFCPSRPDMTSHSTTIQLPTAASSRKETAKAPSMSAGSGGGGACSCLQKMLYALENIGTQTVVSSSSSSNNNNNNNNNDHSKDSPEISTDRLFTDLDQGVRLCIAVLDCGHCDVSTSNPVLVTTIARSLVPMAAALVARFLSCQTPAHEVPAVFCFGQYSVESGAMRTRLLRNMILLHVVDLLAMLRRLRDAVPGKYWGMLEALYKETGDLRLALESGAGEGSET